MAQKEIEGSMKFPLLPLRDRRARGDAGRRLCGLRDAASRGYG